MHKLQHAPPLRNPGRNFDHTNGQNLSEDLFVWSSPNFWAEKWTDSEWRNFSFSLQYSQISCPPFENPAYPSALTPPLTLVSRVLLFLLGHFPTNECELSFRLLPGLGIPDFCL